ncbi:hypothetical protein [Blastomonas sp.]|uniref:hypothetical protein n=1 Tax=Blastomonas sp. TaxID=1909299 RepID=UPI002628E36A|nr:hypothetical protein [Blastomonas sp.]MDM7955439.1 hypothetical protein [Blastomonas sp.]
MALRSFAMSRNLLALGAATLVLVACQRGDDTAAQNEDAALLEDAADPAMKGALEDQILVDPDLVDKSNRNAVLGEGSDGSVPSASVPKGQLAAVQKAAAAAIGPRGLMKAPEPKKVAAEECKDCNQGSTLGAKAAQQTGACTGKLDYAMGWANRMPADFAVYPRANVKEAAGVDKGQCNIRVVNFTTPAALKNVVDFYYTKARRGGYSAEYELRGADHVLGGTKGEQAFVLFLKPMANGGTEVDIVANGGR